MATEQAEVADRGAFEHAKHVLDEAARQSQEIDRTLEKSRKVQRRAIPALKRAGYLKRS